MLQFGLEYSIVVSLCTYVLALFIAFYDTKKYKWWQGLIIASVLCVSVVVLNFGFAALFRYGFNKMQWFAYTFYFSTGIVTFIYAQFFTQHKIKPKIITALVIYAMYFTLTNLGNIVPGLLSDLDPSIGKVLDIGFRWFSFLLLIPFAFLVRVFNMNKIKHIHKTSATFVAIYTLCEVVLSIGYHSYRNGAENPTWFHTFYIALIFIVFAIINVLTYLTFYNVNRSHSDVLELQVRMSELEKNEEMLRMSEENLEEMRRLRHDIKNQYGFMKLLIMEKKYDEFIKFFEQYGDGIIEPLSFISCDNKNVSAILNMELSKARSVGVDFDVKIAIPEQLSYNSVELCSLFTNILDNAIEACCRFKIEKPVVTIRMRKYQEMLYINISNPVPETVTYEDLNLGKTLKENKRIHGYGNKIVSQIIKEHNGHITRTLKKGVFEVEIIMEA